MTIEKLTDEERAGLGAESRYDLPRKLVRIIDAQAAVIERVRSLADDCSTAGYEVRKGIREALAAAPEPTAQVACDENLCRCGAWRDGKRCVTQPERDLAAANARAEAAERRLAELTLAEDGWRAGTKWLSADRDYWKAKCEAAEREAQNSREGRSAAIELMQRAESEAAALRAELENLSIARGLDARTMRLIEEDRHYWRAQCEELRLRAEVKS